MEGEHKITGTAGPGSTNATGTKNKNVMGPLRFELRISAMSRRRHSQLDHEPAQV
jgi:hypothetical protein